ncbi:DUF3299 domain-containing protein [Gilvimarinus sp. 1_MG-2023]|uniref:DUF3299 domain-containing protein n=1 Tax=Gilvimarinus sp. 1_MG-2023 TaxID=3062638 RepID=UPI0026E201FC|nr:DUF3299 domain-containing protein [Gilvimarinus sp. 1_MG-2023]MDO6748161.1 DUF3299 domain-containing protein [Gilvimarinus sp. 1_MG-2023]
MKTVVNCALLLMCLLSTASWARDYQTIEWPDLMPEEDLQALLNRPEWIDEVPEGGDIDTMPPTGEGFAGLPEDDPYNQALKSAKTIPEFDNKDVRIPGFVVPLVFDDEQRITEFLLVPFFGACIHLPPPPPNQVIYATYEQGIVLDALYDPFWVSGKLTIELIETDLSQAAYQITVDDMEIYSDGAVGG